MSDPSGGKAKLRFGPFLADLATQELFKRGKRLKLQQQPMQVLMALLERPHVVVTREDLRTRIWPADTFVDFEHSLNTAVKKVRQALGDNASRPHFIETLPRRGYRFLKDVEATDEAIASRHRQAGREVGRLFAVQSEDAMGCVAAPADEQSFEEWQKLRALSDDVGIAMMITNKRLLLLQSGISVRVLAKAGSTGWWETRILEGEHFGLKALLPRKQLKSAPEQEPV